MRVLSGAHPGSPAGSVLSWLIRSEGVVAKPSGAGERAGGSSATYVSIVTLLFAGLGRGEAFFLPEVRPLRPGDRFVGLLRAASPMTTLGTTAIKVVLANYQVAVATTYNWPCCLIFVDYRTLCHSCLSDLYLLMQHPEC